MLNNKTWFAMAIVVLLAACSRVDQEHYQQLAIGQSFDEVTAILGSADECTDMLGSKTCQWGDEQRFIKATFAADSLLFFSAKGLK